jgi:hypothetical protein
LFPRSQSFQEGVVIFIFRKHNWYETQYVLYPNPSFHFTPSLTFHLLYSKNTQKIKSKWITKVPKIRKENVSCQVEIILDFPSNIDKWYQYQSENTFKATILWKSSNHFLKPCFPGNSEIECEEIKQ